MDTKRRMDLRRMHSATGKIGGREGDSGLDMKCRRIGSHADDDRKGITKINKHSQNSIFCDTN